VDGEIVPDNSRRQMELRLTGLVVKSDNKLRVYNRIYREVFDRAWLDKALLDLRPYGESLNAWVISGEIDESRLLQGSALQQALIWSRDRNLGAEDYRFLNASQAFALEQEQQANQILTAAKQTVDSALTTAQKQLKSLQEQEEQAKQRLAKIERKVNIFSIVFGLVLAATFLAVSWLKRASCWRRFLVILLGSTVQISVPMAAKLSPDLRIRLPECGGGLIAWIPISIDF
jgi:hypothetical protein